MQDMTSALEGDFVKVATCATPTEAHILKGVLEASGLSPHVADAHVIQANSWMTQALGGVRVMVPAAQLAAAHEAIAAFDAGDYGLPGDQPEPVRFDAQTQRLFSPDRAVLLSFALTPIFGAAVQIANARLLGDRRSQMAQWAWLIVLTIASVAAVGMFYMNEAGPLLVFRASGGLFFITVVWYFAYGKDQSKRLLASFGPNYKKRSLIVPALLTFLCQLAIGWGLSAWG